MTGSSPFTVLEMTFAMLSAEPRPLAIDGRRLGLGLPARQIPIGELRSIVVHPTASPDLQGKIIEVVIGHLQQERDLWVVVLGGLLLPGMRRLAEQLLVSGERAPRFHVEAELLSRLLLVIRCPPNDTRRYAMHLLGLARR
jgi:hypothetical protein